MAAEETNTLVIVAGALGAFLTPMAANWWSKRREERAEEQEPRDRVISAVVHDPEAIDHMGKAAGRLIEAIEQLDQTLRHMGDGSHMDARNVENSNRSVIDSNDRLCRAIDKLAAERIAIAIAGRATPGVPPDMSDTLERMR